MSIRAGLRRGLGAVGRRRSSLTDSGVSLRQTDLLVAAAKTDGCQREEGAIRAPWDMRYAVEKIRESGNAKVSLTERARASGTTTWWWICVVANHAGVRAVVFDGTHSVQMPSGANG